MKKYLIGLVALLVVATGCGNTKKLNCTVEEDGVNGAYNMEFDKNDQLTKMTVTASGKHEEEFTKEELEEYKKEAADFFCGDYTEDYMECKVEITEEEYKLTFTYNINKMTDEQKEEEGMTKEETTYEAMKKDAEDTGFTCK